MLLECRARVIGLPHRDPQQKSTQWRRRSSHTMSDVSRHVQHGSDIDLVGVQSQFHRGRSEPTVECFWREV